MIDSIYYCCDNLLLEKPTTPTPASYDISVTPKKVSLHSGDSTILTCTLTTQGDVTVLNVNWVPNEGIIEKKVSDEQTRWQINLHL